MKRLITIAGIAICLGFYVFFISNQIVTYTIYTLSFVVTVLLRIYYNRLDLSDKLVEVYSAVTTIIVIGLFYCMVTARTQTDDHKSLYLTLAVAIGLLNLGYALDLPNVISKNKNI